MQLLMSNFSTYFLKDFTTKVNRKQTNKYWAIMWLCFFSVQKTFQIEESLNQAGAHPTLIERKLKIILIKLGIKKYRSHIIKISHLCLGGLCYVRCPCSNDKNSMIRTKRLNFLHKETKYPNRSTSQYQICLNSVS